MVCQLRIKSNQHCVGARGINIGSMKRLVINTHQNRPLLAPDLVVYIQGLDKPERLFFSLQPLLKDESMSSII